MRQKLTLIAVALLFAIAGLFVYLYNSIDSIVKNGIERYGTDVCGTKVSVGSVDISLKSGRGTVRDLHVANPEGFPHGAAVKFDEVTIDVDVSSINRDPIVIQQIRIIAPEVNAVVNEKLATNIGAIRRHADAYTARTAAPKSGKRDAGFEKRITIKSFVVEKGMVEGDATRIGSEKKQFELPPIELTNVGGERGVPPETMAKVMAAALFARVEQAAGDKLKAGATEKIKDKLEELLHK